MNKHFAARVLSLVAAALAVNLATAMVAAPAFAAGAGELTAGLRACAAKTEAGDRLACFDALAASLPAPKPELTPEQRFGTSQQVVREVVEERKRETEQLDSMASTISNIAQRGDGSRVFTLANGQVWSERGDNSKSRFKVGDKVEIESASFGSFLMTGSSKRSIRVNRVR
ncbi:MAG: hypothetical protein RJB26_325 [Pseudomonadota bacterium]|jgi:hypothetical protein